MESQVQDVRETKILDIIAKELEVPVETLQPSTSLVADLNADSLSLLTILMSVEEALNVEISEEEWRGFSTIGDIVSRVRALPPSAAAKAVGRS